MLTLQVRVPGLTVWMLLSSRCCAHGRDLQLPALSSRSPDMGALCSQRSCSTSRIWRCWGTATPGWSSCWGCVRLQAACWPLQASLDWKQEVCLPADPACCSSSSMLCHTLLGTQSEVLASDLLTVHVKASMRPDCLCTCSAEWQTDHNSPWSRMSLPAGDDAGPAQVEELRTHLCASGCFTGVRALADMFGIVRFVLAHRV